jgi:hypothetical protein
VSIPATLRRSAAVPLLAGLLAAPAAAGGTLDYPHVHAAFGENVADAGDLTGRAVAVIPDVNGDGGGEMVIGAPNDEDGGVDSGTAYVYSPKGNVLLHELHGAVGDNCGQAVANVGDVNDDGTVDFAVGFPGYNSGIFPSQNFDAGKVVVYSGATFGILWVWSGPKEGARAGEAVAGAGDVNGDGHDDVLVGAPSWDTDPDTNPATNQGWAGVYSGKTGALLVSFTGAGTGDALGACVAGVGDLNADARGDYAIGSPGDDYLLGGVVFIVDGGRLDVYSGATHALLFQKQGGQGDELGWSACAAGDGDADGVSEVLVGAPGDASDMGVAYLYEGAAGTFVRSYAPVGFTTAERFGSAVALAGDVNKDGRDDVAIGAPMSTSSIYGGYFATYSGATGLVYGNVQNGPYGGDLIGASIAQGPCNLDGDGWDDVVVGLAYNDVEGADSGYVWGMTFTHFQPDLGFQGPGIPWFTVYGTELYSGGQADIRLQYAGAGLSCWLMASLNQSFLAFKGGILVPDAATSLLLPYVTDAVGNVTLPGVPGGGGYFFVYAQWLVKTPGFAQGWQLSNAVVLEFLP